MTPSSVATLRLQGGAGFRRNQWPDNLGLGGRIEWIRQKPRIAVDRGYNGAADGQIFHFARVHYQPDGGLFFFARFTNEGAQSKFEAALRLLGDCGIGSDRNSGHGQFSFIHEAMPTLKSRHPICLSLLNPDEKDMQSGWLDGAHYDLIIRGGWVGGSSWRKGSLRMFAEGSAFSSRLQGRIVKVGLHPQYGHPVYRDGRAFMIGGRS